MKAIFAFLLGATVAGCACYWFASEVLILPGYENSGGIDNLLISSVFYLLLLMPAIPSVLLLVNPVQLFVRRLYRPLALGALSRATSWFAFVYARPSPDYSMIYLFPLYMVLSTAFWAWVLGFLLPHAPEADI